MKGIKINFNLKSKQNADDHVLIRLCTTVPNMTDPRIRISTGKTVITEYWDKTRQRCVYPSSLSEHKRRSWDKLNKELDEIESSAKREIEHIMEEGRDMLLKKFIQIG
jgi:hypothetical protein